MSRPTAREHILEIARRLTVESGAVPSLNTVAAAAGVSKGGFIHHFPSRDTLVTALAESAIADLDQAMTAAAAEGRAAETWLRLAVLSPDEVALFRALSATVPTLGSALHDLIGTADAANERWETMIAAEVGDPVRARVIRLVGDGLTFSSVLHAPDPADVDSIVSHVLAQGPR